MAMVARALGGSEGVDHRICVSGQHRGMLDSVLRLFNLKPDFDLDVMKPGQDVTYVTCAVLTGVKDVIADVMPDRILVHGDTTTALAAALAAHYARVPVGHVESGLRTGDVFAPWPEEMNRRLADALSDRHYAPTEGARQHLLSEGLPDCGIKITGNTGIDSLQYIAGRLMAESDVALKVQESLPSFIEERKLILVTAHRRESFGEGFDRICRALVEIAARDDVEILFPVHPNPRIQEPARRQLGGLPNIHLIAPLDYLTFVALMMQAYLIITDSGGIQEEAPSLGKPVLLLRAVTERPEAVAAGTVRIVGTDTHKITAEAAKLLDDNRAYRKMAHAVNPYGDGKASDRILSDLLNA